MKNIKIILLFFLYSIQLLYCQEIKQIEVTYVKGLKRINDKSEKAPSVLKDIEYILKADKEKAVFEFNKNNLLKVDENNKRYITQGGSYGIFYTNIPLKEKIQQLEEENRSYRIKHDKYNWILTKEKKVISGYNSYKAYTIDKKYDLLRDTIVQREFVVWYTPEIPFQFGPAGFDGLPGLVLTAKRDGYYYIAKDIKLYKNNQFEIQKPQKGTLINSKQYDSIGVENIRKKYGNKFIENVRKSSRKKRS